MQDAQTLFKRLIWDQPFTCLFLTIAFWCGNYVVAEVTTKGLDIPPVQLAFWRWTIALAILAPFAWRGFVAELPIIRRHLPVLWIIGISSYSFYNTFLYLALERPSSDATSIATLQTVFPAIVAILAFLIFGARLKLLNVAGIALAVVGGLLAATKGNITSLQGLNFGLAELWAALAVLAYAFYTVLLRLRPAGISSLPFLFVLILMGFTILGPWWAIDSAVTGNAFPWQPRSFLILAYLSIFPSLISALCFNRAIQLIGPNMPALSINTMPFGIALIFFLSPLPSQLAWYHLVSLALIFPGIWLVRR